MNRFILSLAAWAARVLPVPVKQAIYKIKPLARLILSPASSKRLRTPRNSMSGELDAGAMIGF